MDDFEKLGLFYLGREWDVERGGPGPRPFLYDSRDLTTHAVVVGMTGSGKTGLCLALLEEAAIDAVPAICIDPKGDLGNLLLTFGNLDPKEFLPWLDPDAAARAGQSVEQFAAAEAARWRAGLAEWGQDAGRVRRFAESVDRTIYTPGSSAGLELAVLKGLSAPPPAVAADEELLSDRVTAAVSGLLGFAGLQVNPVESREHVLLSTILQRAWRRGDEVDLAALVQLVQEPPLERIGVLDLETFYPAQDRRRLALRLNNLLASPTLRRWTTGEPLDVEGLLYTPEGRPRLSVLSIAHLTPEERMFFVTLLLNEVLTWVRTQPGTSSLRAILYMDEVFGYFPPTANPPSKRPMLSLLKQGRAYGLGVVLATQNPVDLDYKGLSNTGTWLLGRLQTERDRQRVLAGLEGVAAESGSEWDRQRIESTLARLDSRVFLVNNVHERRPAVFQSRWALSYLRGPLTREQIATLMADRKRALARTVGADASGRQESGAELSEDDQTAILPDTATCLAPSVEQRFVRPLAPMSAAEEEPAVAAPGQELHYRAALLGRCRLHFVRKTLGIDTWLDVDCLAPLTHDTPQPQGGGRESLWADGRMIDVRKLILDERPREGSRMGGLPRWISSPASVERVRRQLAEHAYATVRLAVWRCRKWKLVSNPGESRRQFMARLRQHVRELRDEQLEALTARSGKKLARLREQIARAETRLDDEKRQLERSSFDTLLSVGSSLLEAVLGRRLASATNVRRAASSARRVRRSMREREDVAQAERRLEELAQQMQALEEEFATARADVSQTHQVADEDVESLEIPPRKKDLDAEPPMVLWLPWLKTPEGNQLACDLPLPNPDSAVLDVGSAEQAAD